MIRINLLPYRAARTKENIRRQISVFSLSIVLIIILFWVFNGYLNGRIEKLSVKLDDLQKEVKRYEEKAKRVEEIKEKLASLNKKIEIVNQLKAFRKAPPKLLAEMTEKVVPDRMQLTKFSADKNSVSLEGMALDNETIAVFMTRLERSSLFNGVNLKSAKQETKFNIDMKNFNIVCKKAVTQEPDKKKADK
ncbi:MAG: PilN domain-containing protein [Desulfobacterales bacterium]|nr:PilN domain-containing protein [Desulfobacterales bacterium]